MPALCLDRNRLPGLRHDARISLAISRRYYFGDRFQCVGPGVGGDLRLRVCLARFDGGAGKGFADVAYAAEVLVDVYDRVAGVRCAAQHSCLATDNSFPVKE